MSFNKEVDYEGLKRAASHYQGEGNYCSVIAFAIATGCKFGKARSLLAKHGQRKTGKGTYQHNIHPIYIDHGKQLVELTFRSGFTLKTAVSKLPRVGVFLIYTAGHVTCIRNGVNHDWSATSRTTKRMKQVFQVIDA